MSCFKRLGVWGFRIGENGKIHASGGIVNLVESIHDVMRAWYVEEESHFWEAR